MKHVKLVFWKFKYNSFVSYIDMKNWVFLTNDLSCLSSLPWHGHDWKFVTRNLMLKKVGLTSWDASIKNIHHYKHRRYCLHSRFLSNMAFRNTCSTRVYIIRAKWVTSQVLSNKSRKMKHNESMKQSKLLHVFRAKGKEIGHNLQQFSANIQSNKFFSEKSFCQEKLENWQNNLILLQSCGICLFSWRISTISYFSRT